MRDIRDFARPWWLLPLGRLHWVWWLGIGAGLIGLEYATGPSRQFPVIYVIPVSLAAWYSGRRTALALAIAVPVAHIILQAAEWKEAGELLPALGTTVFRGAVVVVMALWFARLSNHERALHHYVQNLEGLLPICGFCKSIKNDAGEWEPLETYVSHRSAALFSHGLCARCSEIHYPDLDRDQVTSR